MPISNVGSKTTVLVQKGGPGSGRYPKGSGEEHTNEVEPLSYEGLKTTNFHVSKTDFAAIKHRTIAATKADEALTELIRANGITSPSSKALEAAQAAVKEFIIPVALLTIVKDDDPIID